MTTADNYKEWRFLTPLLLALIVASGAIISYLVIDKLNSMNDKSDKLFTIVGSMKSSFDDYKVTSENRFTRIETQIADFPYRTEART